MKSLQTQWNDGQWDLADKIAELDSKNTLILLFGDVHKHPDAIKSIRALTPSSTLTGCTTAGQIQGKQIHNDLLVATIIYFEKTTFQLLRASTAEGTNATQLGKTLATELNSAPELSHVLVISDGLSVCAADLLEGMTDVLGLGVQITGGLAGDHEDFVKTHLVHNDEVISTEMIVIGFYGKHLAVSSGSRGGWCSFGIERRITQSSNNTLLELDDENALEIYKSYLGDLADQLPASGLRFPLELSEPNKKTKVVRTLLAVDAEKGTCTFAGKIPMGATAQLMRSNVEALIDGAQEAGEVCSRDISTSPQVAILISCVGRKLVLQQLAEDEIEAVSDEFGPNTLLCGFYSYGEIAPFDKNSISELHNQTMTITAFAET